ncbi:MAG: hypothetical protein NPINA01_02720 [Nitrospinaceae bacterium]|nr:MAG: hypothetical protein NPINA01_02720 [Nitrospinaceae bacterium]
MIASTKVLGMALASVITFSVVGTSEAIDSVPLPSKPRWGGMAIGTVPLPERSFFGSVAIDTVPLPGKKLPQGYIGSNGNRPTGDPRVMGTTQPVPDRKFRPLYRGGFGSNTLPFYKVGRK